MLPQCFTITLLRPFYTYLIVEAAAVLLPVLADHKHTILVIDQLAQYSYAILLGTPQKHSYQVYERRDRDKVLIIGKMEPLSLATELRKLLLWLTLTCFSRKFVKNKSIGLVVYPIKIGVISPQNGYGF